MIKCVVNQNDGTGRLNLLPGHSGIVTRNSEVQKGPSSLRLAFLGLSVQGLGSLLQGGVGGGDHEGF